MHASHKKKPLQIYCQKGSGIFQPFPSVGSSTSAEDDTPPRGGFPGGGSREPCNTPQTSAGLEDPAGGHWQTIFNAGNHGMGEVGKSRCLLQAACCTVNQCLNGLSVQSMTVLTAAF